MFSTSPDYWLTALISVGAILGWEIARYITRQVRVIRERRAHQRRLEAQRQAQNAVLFRRFSEYSMDDRRRWDR